MMRVLVVEDDSIILNGLVVGLALHGMTIDGVSTCEDSFAALSTSTFSAVVLDVMLPDGTGLDILRYLRSRQDATPVLLLTARDAIGDRIAGLDEGADDYVVKPFDLDEIAARLRALDRRSTGRASPKLTFRDVFLDPKTFEATSNGEPLLLTRREFAILQTLMQRPGTAYSKTQLEDALYGWQEEVESNTIEVHIHNLRAKIGKDYIQTKRGIGYRLKTELSS